MMYRTCYHGITTTPRVTRSVDLHTPALSTLSFKTKSSSGLGKLPIVSHNNSKIYLPCIYYETCTTENKLKTCYRLLTEKNKAANNEAILVTDVHPLPTILWQITAT